MSNPGVLSSLPYEPETVFGENVNTFATHRIPIRGPVDCSGLQHPKVDSERAVQQRQGGTPWVQMAQGGSFKTKLDLCGHGSTTAGSVTIDPIETFLGYVWGNVTLSAAASTTIASGTAAIPVTVASGTFANGSLCRIGTGAPNADGRGSGQFYSILTHTGTNLSLAGAMIGAPNAADVVYPVACFYPCEVGTSASFAPGVGGGTTPGLRFALMTANMIYQCHGCYPTAVTLSGLNVGERPTVEITWAVSWWTPATSPTFPSAVASNQYNPAVVAAGSLNVQDVGTTTRNARTIRNFGITYTLGVVPLEGPGGASQFQKCIGMRRTVDDIKVTWTEDADANTATPVLESYWLGTTAKHIEWSGSTTPGSALGIALRNVNIVNARPVQKMDKGINRFVIEGEANAGSTLTSDLTQAAFVLGFS